MPEILFLSYAKADPAGVWHPVVLVGKVFFEERVTDGARKRDIHDAACMYMPDFGVSELELAPAEAVRVNGDARPGGHLVDEIFS